MIEKTINTYYSRTSVVIVAVHIHEKRNSNKKNIKIYKNRKETNVVVVTPYRGCRIHGRFSRPPRHHRVVYILLYIIRNITGLFMSPLRLSPTWRDGCLTVSKMKIVCQNSEMEKKNYFVLIFVTIYYLRFLKK